MLYFNGSIKAKNIEMILILRVFALKYNIQAIV